MKYIKTQVISHDFPQLQSYVKKTQLVRWMDKDFSTPSFFSSFRHGSSIYPPYMGFVKKRCW